MTYEATLKAILEKLNAAIIANDYEGIYALSQAYQRLMSVNLNN